MDDTYDFNDIMDYYDILKRDIKKAYPTTIYTNIFEYLPDSEWSPLATVSVKFRDTCINGHIHVWGASALDSTLRNLLHKWTELIQTSEKRQRARTAIIKLELFMSRGNLELMNFKAFSLPAL